jgi:ABC-type microcin C transport system permease subunit YejE
MASTFDPTLQHLEAIDRFERPLARVRAACGEKFDGRRLSSKRAVLPNGMFAEICKILVSSAAATARSAEFLGFHRRPADPSLSARIL